MDVTARADPVRRGSMAVAWCVANLTVLLVTALLLAETVDENISSTPAGDGAVLTVIAAGVLTLVNGLFLCATERGRAVGIGLLVGVLAFAPVGNLVVLLFVARNSA